jgi:NADH-quinone oxidoreductase subunit K
MNETALLTHYVALGSILFALGLAGFLVRRNVILMFLCVELMLQGVSLCLIGWGRLHDVWDGQTFVTFIIAVAACEAGIALVLVLMLCQYADVLDITRWQAAREPGTAAFVDCEVPEDTGGVVHRPWPSLTSAGLRPEADPQKEMVRPHV